ncbi:hypothetical protein ACQKP8_23280 [Photobacterium alginatilyticum]
MYLVVTGVGNHLKQAVDRHDRRAAVEAEKANIVIDACYFGFGCYKN